MFAPPGQIRVFTEVAKRNNSMLPPRIISYKGARYRRADTHLSEESVVRIMHDIYESDKKSYWWHVFLLQGKELEQKGLGKALKRWETKYQQLQPEFQDIKVLNFPLVDYKNLLPRLPVPPELWSIGVDLPARDV